LVSLSNQIITQLVTLEKKSYELIQYEQKDLIELELLKEAILNDEIEKPKIIEAIDSLIKNSFAETGLIKELRSDLNSIVLK